MTSLFLKRFRASVSVVAFEVYCFACCLLGFLKVSWFFDKKRVNRLEIGAGLSRKQGFLALDLDLRAPFPFDLRAGLPFPDDSIDFIYAEHVLEHFGHRDIVTLLAECRRVLKPGRVLSVSVPDAALYLDGYRDPRGFDREKFLVYDAALNYGAAVNLVNYMFHMDGHHRHMFDREGLLLALSDAGFVEVCSRDFDPQLDLEVRQHESIYAQGAKPGDGDRSGSAQSGEAHG
jgi:SAM-dependent methyltransferase